MDFGAVTAGQRLLHSYTPDPEQSLKWLVVINTVLCHEIARGAPYVSGYFAVTEELLAQAKPTYHFVTMLRDPVARWRSNYVYSGIRAAQGRAHVTDIANELEQYHHSSRAVQEGAKYVRYLGGFRLRTRLATRRSSRPRSGCCRRSPW